MATSVIMPQMGESVVEGTVGKWLKQEGDPVEEYEPLLEVETDKVTSEVTASAGGTLLKIYIGEGQTVPAGTVLALIGEPGEQAADAAPPASDAHHTPQPASAQAQIAEQASRADPSAPVAAISRTDRQATQTARGRYAACHAGRSAHRRRAQRRLRQVPGTGRRARDEEGHSAYLKAARPKPPGRASPEQPGSGDLSANRRL